MKKFLSIVLSLAMVFSLSATAFAAETSGSPTVEVTTDQNEIYQILNEKGIYDENEKVLSVIEITVAAPAEYPTAPAGIVTPEYRAEFSSSGSSTKYPATYTNNYPAGSFDFEQEYVKGWQLTASLGLEVEVLSAAIGYTLNSSRTDTWTYHSPKYNYDFTVNAYLNYDYEYWKIYEDDLINDDYLGLTKVERETGYTLKVIAQ